MPAYDAVLFDQDGVLVEPPARDTQAAATRSAFADCGVRAVEDRHVADIVDGVTRERFDRIAAAYDLDPTRLWTARERRDEESQLAAFRAGSRSTYDDVRVVPELNVPCGVVSNNHDSTVAFVLEYFDLAAWFETAVGRPKTLESLRRKKPNPAYLERARATLDAECVLYVGDSETDLLAARRAGMDTAFLRRSHRRTLDPDPTPTHDVASLAALPALLA